MKTYNLKLTHKQTYLVDCHIFDHCNYFTNGDYSDEKLATFDEYDQLRIRIYRKHKRLDKKYYLFSNLTEEEIKFISREIDHWAFGFERDLSECANAKRIIKKIEDVLDVQKQRADKLNFLLR